MVTEIKKSTEEKELVWLPKSLAEKIKDLNYGKVLEAEIMQYFEQSKKNMQIEVESLEDSVLQYRGYMIKAKNAFREAKEEQLDSAYALWEKFEDDMKGIRDYVGKAKKEIEPLKNELQELKKLMGEVNVFALKDFMGIVKELSNVYYNSETQNMIRFLLNNYKKPEG